MLENKPVNLIRLNRIWNGIKSGELNHNQQFFHCGTAHCIAGWEIVFLLEENNISIKIIDKGLITDFTLFTLMKAMNLDIDPNEYTVAQVSLGLNDNEARMLFAGGMRFEVQNALVEYLNQGYRLTNRAECHSVASFDSKDSCSIYLRGDRIHWDKFTDMLIEKEIEYSFDIVQ